MFQPQDIRAVVFDIGGTLLDFTGRETRAHMDEGAARAHAWLTERGMLRIDQRAYQKRMFRRFLRAYLWSRVVRGEMSTMANIRAAHRALGVRLDDEALNRIARLMYEPIRPLGRADPQTRDALADLRDRGYRLAVVSNTVAPPPGLDDHLNDHQLLDLLPVRVYSCQVGVPKPHPRIFRAVLSELDIPAANAVYVGDKPRIDVAGARRVGMATILRHNGDGGLPRGPRADCTIQRIADLLDIFPAKSA